MAYNMMAPQFMQQPMYVQPLSQQQGTANTCYGILHGTQEFLLWATNVNINYDLFLQLVFPPHYISINSDLLKSTIIVNSVLETIFELSSYCANILTSVKENKSISLLIFIISVFKRIMSIMYTHCGHGLLSAIYYMLILSMGRLQNEIPVYYSSGPIFDLYMMAQNDFNGAMSNYIMSYSFPSPYKIQISELSSVNYVGFFPVFIKVMESCCKLLVFYYTLLMPTQYGSYDRLTNVLYSIVAKDNELNTIISKLVKKDFIVNCRSESCFIEFGNAMNREASLRTLIPVANQDLFEAAPCWEELFAIVKIPKFL